MMVDQQHYFVGFDLFQQLVVWLNISMRNTRRGRRFLESNPNLLRIEADRELERIISAHAEDETKLKQQMLNHLLLLKEARRHLPSKTAIAEAYVNMYGGTALELPCWLEGIEKQRALLEHFHRPDRTTRTHLSLLRQAIAVISQETSIPLEIFAEMKNDEGQLLAQGLHHHTFESRLAALDEAISCHRLALAIYTEQRYPLQYARTMTYLGNTYQEYTLVGQKDIAEQAIDCYEAALQIYDQTSFPAQWTLLQTYLGRAYSIRQSGTRSQNLTQAIHHHRAALQVATLTEFPTVWATVQVNLGDVYRQRLREDASQNFQEALRCYKASLQISTLEQFPRNWADIHTKLAALYQNYSRDHKEKQDLYLRCAIVCYECALKVYTVDSFPIECGRTLVNLATVYRRRTEGEREANLEQAMEHYRSALHIFTNQTFPTEYHQMLLDIAEIETERKQHDKAFKHPLTRV